MRSTMKKVTVLAALVAIVANVAPAIASVGQDSDRDKDRANEAIKHLWSLARPRSPFQGSFLL